jgi:Transposase DDE domain
VITGFTLTPAHGSEREARWELVPQIRGLLIGDKGYLSASLRQELRSVGITLETPLRSNTKDHRSPAEVRLVQRVRRLVETVIGLLTPPAAALHR